MEIYKLCSFPFLNYQWCKLEHSFEVISDNPLQNTISVINLEAVKDEHEERNLPSTNLYVPLHMTFNIGSALILSFRNGFIDFLTNPQ